MFGFLKRKRCLPFDQLLDRAKPAVVSRDECEIVALFDEIIERCDEDPQKTEAYLGLAILTASELELECIGPYLEWFIEQFPRSISPVRVEMALFLASTGQYEEGTEQAREYLRVVRDGGHFPNLARMPIAQLGTCKAFLPLTAVYTHLGARSHSKRILAFALNLPILPEYREASETELARLNEELADPSNARQDARWEALFAHGKGARELIDDCERKECRKFARRVELLEGHFRFRKGYQVDEEEFFLLQRTVSVEGKDAVALI